MDDDKYLELLVVFGSLSLIVGSFYSDEFITDFVLFVLGVFIFCDPKIIELKCCLGTKILIFISKIVLAMIIVRIILIGLMSMTFLSLYESSKIICYDVLNLSGCIAF